MKKLFGWLGLLGFTLLLGACSNNVTQEDLQANRWVFETEDTEMQAVAKFSDKVMTLTIDSSGMESSASNEWEEIGESFAQEIINNLKFKVNYTLEGDNLHLKSSDLGLDHDYKVTKEDQKIVLEIQDDSDDESGDIVLEPYSK